MPGTFSPFDPEAQHEHVDAKIVAALERLSQAFRVLLWEVATETGLSPIQIQFLVYLRFLPGGTCRIGDLARRFDLTPATVSDAVRTLAAKGLLSRVPDPDDRRARLLALTPAGRETAGRLAGWAGALQAYLAGYTDAEKLPVMRFLMNLIAHLHDAGVITVARMCLTCRFFAPDRHDDPDAPHHCRLLDRPLRLHQLRLDCPEHEPASG
ncbi:MarR family winged helix-turn-helix transcriptional regulator [Rhodocaloribacter litoris]|uniref:MarR family winged helix-turn-helix transcriptional regulator n=1 Tax=Rhodocaloribacter litoris TaxID=2558931 RepID=UPI001424A052|nr:MarR family winged helix-turn-helix transcriptional regulator [Rhodocaloribacter litoris]QXD14736.1 MarR family winged helix-turn-helix transcriptional regulator [Rhodocaloribacter litoris]GIV59178.1 MAG: transcriptional regulator [Rhodothermaceae bacterium]